RALTLALEEGEDAPGLRWAAAEADKALAGRPASFHGRDLAVAAWLAAVQSEMARRASPPLRTARHAKLRD
ncbi:MAG: hypothetical protein ACJ8H8_04060, partial [Geminicoccaceae bacterium]